MGDLPGIISRLDYIDSLGVTAVWLNPIYSSPNDDNGHDISDYRSIMSDFGIMADFDRLLVGVHGAEPQTDDERVFSKYDVLSVAEGAGRNVEHAHAIYRALQRKEIDKVVGALNTVLASVPYDLWQRGDERTFLTLVHLPLVEKTLHPRPRRITRRAGTQVRREPISPCESDTLAWLQ